MIADAAATGPTPPAPDQPPLAAPHRLTGEAREYDWRRRVAVIAAAIIVGAAALWGGIVYLQHRSVTGAEVLNDGPTFYEAFSAVNISVVNDPGGPWVPSQVYGVASPIPSYPSAWGWPLYDRTFASCGAAFSGLTIWNGTLPVFNGTFNSGTAPFWQFVFFSNDSHELLVATDVLNTVHLFAPISLSSPCATASGLGDQPWLWEASWHAQGFPSNTPSIAQADWSRAGEKWATWLKAPTAQLYLFGGAPFGPGSSSLGQVEFYTCGTAGAAGVTPALTLSGGSEAEPDNFTFGCTPTTGSDTPTSLTLNWTNTTVFRGGGAQVISQTFHVWYAGPPPSVGPGYNAAGLTSWMLNVSLSDSAGELLQLGASRCTVWTASADACPSNPNGWYAVLLAPDGSWLGTFGTTPYGPAWNSPVVPVVNNDSLAVVVPYTWNVTGDILHVGSTTSTVPLNGTIGL